MLNITILSDFYASELRDSMELWAGKLGLAVNLMFAPYGAVIPYLIQPDIRLMETDLLVVLIQMQSEGVIVDAESHDSEHRSPYSLETLVEAFIAARMILKCPMLAVICADSNDTTPKDDVLRHALESYQIDVLSVNEYISDRKFGRCHLENDASVIGLASPHTSMFFATVGTRIMRWIYREFVAPRKLIVVDCDNTLWFGNCAEVGPSGVEINSEALLLQKCIVNQHNAGKLICLCSKNNEADVMAVFDKNPNMLLRREHIAFIYVNWDPKFLNVKRLAHQAAVEPTSIIFLDDDPFECDAMSSFLPEVYTVRIPANDRAATIEAIWDFDSTRTTAEDLNRAQSYQDIKLRDEALAKFSSFEAFLEHIDLRVVFRKLEEEDLGRASQLSQRVTQFNLNGNWYSAKDLQYLAALHTCEVMSARDRFGDYGTVGLLIHEAKDEKLEIKGMFLSCRVLRRGAEQALIKHILELASQSCAKEIALGFRRTSRNIPMEEFLDVLGDRSALVKITEVASASTNHGHLQVKPRGLTHQGDDPASVIAELAQTRSPRPITNAPHEEPVGSTEAVLEQVWSEVLRISEVGRQDNFFELRGDSLHMLKILNRIRSIYECELDISIFFTNPTISGLAAAIEASIDSRLSDPF